MTSEQARKLLGGYASGTLTPEEQQTLFAAALEHQELFDELGREEPLRELLSDPVARARLYRGLETPPPGWQERARRWLLGHAVGLAAMAGIVGVFGYVGWQIRPAPEKIRMIAQEPTRVEVNGNPRREFDVSTLSKQARPEPVIPPPPVLKQTTGSAPAQLPPAVAALSPKTEVPEPADIVALERQELPPLSNPAADTARPLAVSSFRAPELPQPGVPAAESQPEAAQPGVAGRQTIAIPRPMAGPAQPATTIRRTAEQNDAYTSASARPVLAIAGSASGGSPNAANTPLTTGLRYRILKKSGPGRFTAAGTNQFVAGDVIMLSFDASYPGSVKVIDTAAAAPGVVFEWLVENTIPTSSPEIPLDKPGTRVFRVEFNPTGRSAPKPAFITLTVK